MEMVDLIKADDLMEMVEASVMSEDPSFLLDNWEEGEAVRAVSQWEDETYQVSSSFTFVATHVNTRTSLELWSLLISFA